MSIYYDCDKKGVCKSYEQEVLKVGLAKIYSKSNLAVELAEYENPSKYKQQLEKAPKLNLVVLNKNNGKYHKTTCEYGWMAAKYEVVKKHILSFKYKPASCCYNAHKKWSYTKKYKLYTKKVKPCVKEQLKCSQVANEMLIFLHLIIKINNFI